MTTIDDLLPQKHERVMDVVAEAGIDVSDWSNYADGKDNPSANPRYCYSWCFVQTESFVLLNLWHGDLKDEAGTIYHDINCRALASTFELRRDKATWARRARDVDLALQKAWREKLPVKVVVCDGQPRDITTPGSAASKVERRLLDPVTWAVTQYDWVTGQAAVTRGVPPEPYIDQFTLPPEASSTPFRTVRLVEVANRSSEIRRAVLRRAGGVCELCGQAGFKMLDGRVFLETHHVVPISENGPDVVSNVTALCPNHHREAHHGERQLVIRQTLLAHLAK